MDKAGSRRGERRWGNGRGPRWLGWACWPATGQRAGGARGAHVPRQVAGGSVQGEQRVQALHDRAGAEGPDEEGVCPGRGGSFNVGLLGHGPQHQDVDIACLCVNGCFARLLSRKPRKEGVSCTGLRTAWMVKPRTIEHYRRRETLLPGRGLGSRQEGAQSLVSPNRYLCRPSRG